MFANGQHNSQLQYSRSPFEFPFKDYESYQENGTKYLKSLKTLPENLQEELNGCAGEIFISGIPPEVRAQQIAEIAALLGELYVLRFKVNFSGNSRGFAYLQYIDPSLMHLALARLPLLFRQHSYPMIRVRESRNSSKLLLKKTQRMSPQAVHELLSQVIKFNKLIGREVYPGCYEYQIVFRCNEEAVHARRELLRCINQFGRNAIVVWDTSMEVVDPKFSNSKQIHPYLSSLSLTSPSPSLSPIPSSLSPPLLQPQQHQDHIQEQRNFPLSNEFLPYLELQQSQQQKQKQKLQQHQQLQQQQQQQEQDPFTPRSSDSFFDENADYDSFFDQNAAIAKLAKDILALSI